MVAQSPLNRLALVATSVADDLGFVALADLSRVMAGDAYRVIGGHMVTALVARWGLGPHLYRETGDADLGVPPFAVTQQNLVERLLAIGYQRRAGNRFGRPMDDVPVHLVGAEGTRREAVIDVLVPNYQTRARHNVRVGDHLVTTEVPGLSFALRRPAVGMSLLLHRLNGEVLDIELAVPDEVSAIVLKASATKVRSKATDIVDLWRCLEIGLAAGLGPSDFASADESDAASVARHLFAERSGPGMVSLIDEQRLSKEAADQRFTRIAALVQRVLGSR